MKILEDGSLEFTCDLVAYKTNSSHIEDKLIEMEKLMVSGKIPKHTHHCQNCNYIIAGGELIKDKN